MPDPLLVKARFEGDFGKAATTARRLGARLSHDGLIVFLECQGPGARQMLARIDCRGYAFQPPDVQFLNAAGGHRTDAPASANMTDWPSNPPPIKRNSKLQLCLAGTKSYIQLHGDPGFVPTLSRLVGTLALWCRGHARMLQRRPGR